MVTFYQNCWLLGAPSIFIVFYWVLVILEVRDGILQLILSSSNLTEQMDELKTTIKFSLLILKLSI
jgi:hypothetical protein